MKRSQTLLILFFLGFLILANVLIWQRTLAAEGSGILKVYFLDIGQGDATLIESPTGHQLLIDGGPGSVVLSQLSQILPYTDHTIDAILATHPDQDHIGGLPDVLAHYDVGLALTSGVADSGGDNRALTAAIAEEGLVPVLARRGMVLDFGGGARLQILFPDRDVSNVETNTGSIVARLTYGNTSYIFTGDSPQAIEKYLVSIEHADYPLHSDVLKVGHHGSKTSSSEEFITAVEPTYAVISVGIKNKYGHPNQETLSTLGAEHAKILRTDEQGRIEIDSDGSHLTVRQ